MAFDIKEVMGSKIGPVPFPVAAGGVIVGAFVYSMWRNRQAGTKGTTDQTATEPGGDNTDTGQPIFVANPSQVQPTTSAILTSTGVAATNDDWGKQAVSWLIANRHTDAVTAQRVIDGYLNGDPQSFQDGQLRDSAINALGLPPELPQPGGSTATPAPQRLPAPVLTIVKATLPHGKHYFQLKWAAVPGAKEYHMLRNGKVVEVEGTNKLYYRVPATGAYSVTAIPASSSKTASVSNTISVAQL